MAHWVSPRNKIGNLTSKIKGAKDYGDLLCAIRKVNINSKDYGKDGYKSKDDKTPDWL